MIGRVNTKIGHLIDNMFNKTRIFLTISEEGEVWDYHRRGECFYKDIDSILPMKEGQSIHFKTNETSYSARIRNIMWLTDLGAMGVYTDIIDDVKSIDYANLCYVAESFGWIAIR